MTCNESRSLKCPIWREDRLKVTFVRRSQFFKAYMERKAYSEENRIGGSLNFFFKDNTCLRSIQLESERGWEKIASEQ